MSARARRLLALFATCVLVLAACGDDDGPLDLGGDGTTTTNGAATDTSNPGGADDPPVDDGSGAPPPAPGDTAPPGSSAPPPSGAPTTAPVVVPAVGDVGSYGTWYLRADTAATIRLEVRSQSGAEPRASSVDRIRTQLARFSGKSVEVSGGSVPGGARSWSPGDLRAEADRASASQSADRAVLTVLFLRGGLAGSETSLGVAVRSDVAAIFSDRVDEAAGLLGDGERIENAVVTHELGHLLGLVDLLLDTGRQDPEHPGHSPNRRSVMYYAVESTLVGDLLEGGPPTEFDDADRADLARIAGR